MTSDKSSLVHVDGCVDQRVEAYEQDGPRNGLAYVTRCCDCNSRSVTWLTPPTPYRTPVDPFAGITDPAQRQAITARLVEHLDHARRETAARERNAR